MRHTKRSRDAYFIHVMDEFTYSGTTYRFLKFVGFLEGCFSYQQEFPCCISVVLSNEKKTTITVPLDFLSGVAAEELPNCVNAFYDEFVENTIDAHVIREYTAIFNKKGLLV